MGCGGGVTVYNILYRYVPRGGVRVTQVPFRFTQPFPTTDSNELLFGRAACITLL